MDTNNSSALNEQDIHSITMVQGIIDRMSTNSRHYKTLFLAAWAVVVLTECGRCDWVGVALPFTLALPFWHMDTKHLQTERKLRMHHKNIVNGTLDCRKQWDIDLSRYEAGYWSCFFSYSEMMYPILAIIAALICFL